MGKPITRNNMAGSNKRGRRRPDTPMPTTRFCNNCNTRHGAPTGKKCAVAAARANLSDDTVGSNLGAPLCEDEIQSDLGQRLSSSPVPAAVEGKKTSSIPPSSGPGSLNFLADTMAILHKNMQSMQAELVVMREDRVAAHSDSWQQLQGIHDSSRLNNVNNNAILSQSPPIVQTARQPARMQLEPISQTVTLNTLRTQEDCRRKGVAQYAELEKEAAIGDGSTGEFHDINSKRSVRSGRDRTGVDDSRRIYVKWPQEACFIGPDRSRVKYDDLTHPQWISGLITIASEECNPKIQGNMFKYLAALQQDVCDFGFLPSKGAHSLILSYIEEGKTSWDDLPMIQALRESYTLRSQSVRASTHSVPSVQTQAKIKPGNDRTRICKNYNTGACTREGSHVSNGIKYTHFCSFCNQRGSRYGHTELECKRKPNLKPVSRDDLA